MTNHDDNQASYSRGTGGSSENVVGSLTCDEADRILFVPQNTVSSVAEVNDCCLELFILPGHYWYEKLWDEDDFHNGEFLRTFGPHSVCSNQLDLQSTCHQRE